MTLRTLEAVENIAQMLAVTKPVCLLDTVPTLTEICANSTGLKCSANDVLVPCRVSAGDLRAALAAMIDTTSNPHTMFIFMAGPAYPVLAIE